MSRKSRRGKAKPRVEAAPEEILAEGSGPVRDEGVVAHVGIDLIGNTEGATDVVATPGPASDAAVDDAIDTIDTIDAAEVEQGEAVELEADAAIDVAEVEAAAAAADQADALDADVASLEAAGEDALVEVSEEEAAELGATLPTSAASMDAVQLKHLVESLTFASDKPITVQRLRQLTRVSDTRRLEQALVDLAEDYRERGIVLQQVSGGYQFRTRTQFSAWVQQLIAGRPVRLSRAQLETLAIIAYRQPITRPEIDEIRGVDSSATLKLLLDRSLIRILGKKEEVGRPMLYGTTKEFLDFFSLGDLRELPTLREYSELTDESRQVMSDRLGVDPDGEDPDDDGSGGGGGGGGGEGGGGGDPVELTEERTLDDLLASYASSVPDEQAGADGERALADDEVAEVGEVAEVAVSSDAEPGDEVVDVAASGDEPGDEVVDVAASGDEPIDEVVDVAASGDEPGDEVTASSDEVAEVAAASDDEVGDAVIAAGVDGVDDATASTMAAAADEAEAQGDDVVATHGFAAARDLELDDDLADDSSGVFETHGDATPTVERESTSE